MMKKKIVSGATHLLGSAAMIMAKALPAAIREAEVGAIFGVYHYISHERLI